MSVSDYGVAEVIELWRNAKTNDIYVVEDMNVTNATNAADGERMVLYYRYSDRKFVRNHAEFVRKFYRLGSGCVYPREETE